MENLNSSMESVNEVAANNNLFSDDKSDSLKWSQIYFIGSIIIFAFCILATLYLYISNTSIDWEINDSNLKISQFTQTINDLKNNNQIVAYNTIKDALPTIEKSINDSKVQVYINELTRIWRKYKIDFSWFSYENKKISTSAVANATNNNDAIGKISNFIKDYRVKTDNVFALDPISSVSWDITQRSFQVGFLVK